MSGRAHRQDLRGLSTTVSKGGVKNAVSNTSPDGELVDYQGIYDRQHNAERTRAGKARPGESGSEILDYQKPYEQDSQKRGR